MIPLDFIVLPLLKWPNDASIIARLSLQDKIYWYSSIDAREMVFLGQNQEFKKFWYWHYLLPLRVKRFVYKIKTVLRFKI